VRYSVVIPARNSGRTIRTTIDALRNGTRSADEILVVDGCSEDGTAEIARQRGARVVVNPKRHTAAARQCGVVSCTGDVIAFTDSDCIPAADWLQRIAGRFESDPLLDGVGGKVVLSAPRNEIQRYSAHVFENIMRFPDSEVLVARKGMAGSFAGANCAYRKDAVQRVGGFREEFTNHAEEIDLFWRLIDGGAKLLFDPAIQVEHLEYPDSLARLAKTNFRYGFASSKLAKHHIGWQVDTALYVAWLRSFGSLLHLRRHDPWAGLKCLQIATFIAGKICSSIVLRTVNL
jgi:glycosyltransferase involved in cell wall biosynthesis